MRWILLFTVVLVACASLALARLDTKPPDDGSEPLKLVGINIAGGEFSEKKLPGEYGRDYSYPDSATIKYFASKRMNIIRVPSVGSGSNVG